MTPAARRKLVARYRSAVAAVHGTADPIPLPKLFIPRRLEPIDGTSDSWTTTRLLQELLHPQADGKAARISVIGEAGSGKTTLCHFIAAYLAGAADLVGTTVTDQPLPLLITLAEYGHASRGFKKPSIVDFLRDEAEHHLQVPLPDGFLEPILEQGQAVLLVDGLDEVQTPGALLKLLLHFCQLYPRVPVLTTDDEISHFDGRSWTGDGTFRQMWLAPWNDDDVQLFAHRWAVLHDSGADELVAALTADAEIHALARNPLLATVIAYLHRHVPRLPAHRAGLYERYLAHLLETVPTLRGQRFREIDEGLQRAYLEALAHHRRKKQPSGQGAGMIERKVLLGELLVLFRQRQGKDLPTEVLEPRLERWVEHLAAVGFLVPRRPGLFAFLHPALFNYLVAGGLAEAEGNKLASFLAHRVLHSDWRDVCVLAVARQATNKSFLDQLFAQLQGRPDVESRFSFLLQCLAEGAAFDDAQRQEIVRGAGAWLLELRPQDWIPEQRALAAVRRSSRHGEWAETFIRRELETATGQALQGIVALCSPESAEVTEVLRQRPDAAEIAAALLDVFPTLAHRWAAGTVSAPAALRQVLEETADEILVRRSLAAVAGHGGSGRLAAPLLVGVVRLALRTASFVRERAKGPGMLPALQIQPGSWRVGNLPLSPAREPATNSPDAVDWKGYFAAPAATATAGNLAQLFASNAPDAASESDGDDDFAKLFATTFADRFVSAAARDVARGLAGYFARDLTRYAGGFARFFGVTFGSYFVTEYLAYISNDLAAYRKGDLARDFARDIARDLARDFPGAFAGEFADDFASRFAVTFLDEVAPGIASPASGAPAQALAAEDPETARHSAEAVIARWAGEAWEALATTTDLEERGAFVHRRLENAWLFYVWPGVDDVLPATPTSDQLALYFALGWTQATTTWQWPATDRWISFFTTEPPRHWLPRSQWHLCWLLHDPDDPQHRNAVDAALAEGLNDNERPGVAAALRELGSHPAADGPAEHLPVT